MNDDDIVLLSSVATVCGSLLAIFGFALHNQYSFSTSVDSVIHLHYSVLIILLIGIAVAAIGLIGMLYGSLKRYL